VDGWSSVLALGSAKGRFDGFCARERVRGPRMRWAHGQDTSRAEQTDRAALVPLEESR